MEEDQSFINGMKDQEIIFLLGVHKSGTSLLRSLFEGHRDLYTIPLEAHYFANAGYRVNYPLRKEGYKEKVFSDEAINWIEHSNRSKNEYGDGNASGFFNEEEFSKALLNLSVENGPEELLHYFKSILISDKNYSNEGNKVYVEKSVDNLEFAQLLSRWFPKAKFIHIVRNPYSNLVSLRKYRQKGSGQYPSLPIILKTLEYNFTYLENNRMSIPNYLVLKYEDLLLETEPEMKRLADFLGIEYVSSMLHPTFGGESWNGNSTSDEKFEGVSSKNIDAWKDLIFPHEVHFINQMFGSEMKSVGYDMITPGGSFWKKAKQEKWKMYFYNRLFKYYSLP